MSFLIRLRKHSILVAFVAVWIPAVGFGINTLLKYSMTPGDAGAAPSDWPRSAPIARARDRSTLVMFVHPQCVCTRASLGELALIMAHAPGSVDASVFFYFPSEESGAWTRTDLWEKATSIPGVRAFEDRDASAARSFGALTSGQTLLYDRTGQLLFKGGITAYRGHSGDNAGRSAILALLQGSGTPIQKLPVITPVFGCSLRGA